jgi:pilus assembly protein CpaB
VSPRVRRRRGLLLLALSLASGALAASLVRDRVASVERRVGPLVSVAVAARDLPAGGRLRPRDVRLRRVPAAYVPRDALGAEAIAGGGRVGGPVAAGSYLTAGILGGGRSEPAAAALRPGQRAVEVAVASGPAPGASAAPGSRVDVVVSTEPREGPGRTFVAIEGAELLELRSLGDRGGELDAGAAEGARGAATAVATLRVSARQAVYLTAAQNYAREVRLLARAPGDRRGIGRAAVGAGGL